jgi:HEAT repeat protein
MALGASRSSAAVGPLAAGLTNAEPRVRNAAIRGLGQIGGSKAKQALEGAASAHPDAATRRRAQAELRSVEARGARAD